MAAVDSERLATRLYFAAIHLQRRLRREDHRIGLTPAQLSAISTLVSNGPMPLSELAEAEQVTPPTITRLVQRLEADGLVLRDASASDARVSVVRHTTRAWTALERAARVRVAALAEDLAGLDDAELETLERGAGLLERIVSPARPEGARPEG